MSMNYPAKRSTYLVLALLALLMAVTRLHHFGTPLHLPDASLAVFFLGGFYVRRAAFFLLFSIEAALIDYVAITQFGVSSFCVSPAYGFLLPTYALLWMGGYRLLSVPLNARFFGYALMSWLLVASLAFLVSDASFYLLSGRFSEVSLTQYVSRAQQYYLPYISSPLLYLLMVAVLHYIVDAVRKARASQIEH